MTRIVKKPQTRRREILDAARELFQSRSYDQATIQELMTTLNIAKGTIYHYFASKEALFEAVVEDLIDEEFRKKDTLLSSSAVRQLNALERLRLLINTETLVEDQAHLFEMLHHPGNINMHARQLGRYLTRLAPLYAAVIEEGCVEGIFSTEYPLECAEFMLAGMQFLTDVGFYPWSQEQLVRRLAAFPVLLQSQLHAPYSILQ